MQTLTDAELLGAYASRQDESAFGELMRRHGALVCRACHRLLKDTHEAEDASSAMVVPAAAQARTGTVQTADATNSAPWEVTLSAEDYKQLDTSEGVLLAEASNHLADNLNELVKVPKYAKDTYLIRAGLYCSKK